MNGSVSRETLHGDALQAPEDEELAGAPLSIGLDDLFDRLWRLLISMRTGLALILVLTFLALVGTLLEQTPPGLTSDPRAYAQWVDGLRPRYGGWTDVFNVLGFFSVFGSVWFKVTVVLLTTSLLACAINRTPRLWRMATRPRVAVSEGFLAHAPLAGSVSLRGGVEAAVAALQGELRGHHYRTIVTEDANGVALYADRFRWGPFGTVVAHLSMLVILLGAVIGATQGYRVTDFAIPVGSTVSVGNATNLAVRADSFTDSWYSNGTPADYASDLVVFAGGQEIARKTIRVNDPLRIGDLTFFQSFFGPAADVRITDGAGATIADQGVAMLWQSRDVTKSVGQLDLPDRGMTVYVLGPASGKVDKDIRPGQIEFEVYSNANTNAPIGVATVDQGKSANIGGLTYSFLREEQFTGLIVSKDPGAPLVWIGIGLLVAGTILVFLFPHRRIWGRVSRSGDGVAVRVAAESRHDAAFESSFRELLEHVRATLPASGS